MIRSAIHTFVMITLPFPNWSYTILVKFSVFENTKKIFHVTASLINVYTIATGQIRETKAIITLASSQKSGTALSTILA